MSDKKILEDVIRIAKKAGETVLFYYDKDYKIKDKGGDSPVTEADLASNNFIISELEKYNYGILSEESLLGGERLKKERVWIIDPLDGTKDFIDKTGEFTIMIALVENGVPILGAVYQPAFDNLYYALQGEGAFLETKENTPTKLGVSDSFLGEKTKLVSSRFHRSDLEIELAQDLGIEKIVTCGSAGLKICKIASGEADLNINPSDRMGEWDVCAADIILHEAGGELTGVSGEKIIYNKKEPGIKKGYIAANKVIHSSVIQKINK